MRQVVITEQGVHVHAESESLLLARGGIEIQRIRLGEMEQLLLCGRIELSSGAIIALTRRNIEVVFLTEHGRFRARLWTRHGPDVALRIKQLNLVNNPDFAISLARRMIAAKMEHQRRILLRAQRNWKDPDVGNSLSRLRHLVNLALSAATPPALLGMEGEAAALYFRHFNKLIKFPDMAFNGRSRRPPKDPPNACLSFGYTLLGTIIESDVLRRGLDPFPGVFHEPRYNRASLALDILEEFRPLVDSLTLRLINCRQIGPADFENPAQLTAEEALEESEPVQDESGSAGLAVYLNATGRKVFLAEFYSKLRDKIYYPPRDASMTLREIITEQVELAARCFRDNSSDYTGFIPG